MYKDNIASSACICLSYCVLYSNISKDLFDIFYEYLGLKHNTYIFNTPSALSHKPSVAAYFTYIKLTDIWNTQPQKNYMRAEQMIVLSGNQTTKC